MKSSHQSNNSYAHTVEAEVDLKNKLLSMTEPDPTASFNQPVMACLAELDALIVDAEFSDNQVKADLLKLKPPFALLNQHLFPTFESLDQKSMKQQPLHAVIEMLHNIHKRIASPPELLSILNRLKQCYMQFATDFCTLTSKEQKALLQSRIFLRSTEKSVFGWRSVKAQYVKTFLPSELEMEKWKAEVKHYVEQKIVNTEDFINANLHRIQSPKELLIWEGDKETLKQLTSDHVLFENIKARIDEIKEMIKEFSNIPYRQLPVVPYPYATINVFDQASDPLTHVLQSLIHYYQGQINAVCELSHEDVLSWLKPFSGHHLVTSCNGVHFKFFCHELISIDQDDSDAPGIEQAVNALNRILNQQATTPVQFLAMELDGKRYHVLASKTIPGEDLSKILVKTPEVVDQFNPENYTTLIYLNWLTNHGDGNASNVRGTINEKQQLNLTVFDTDRCFKHRIHVLNNAIYLGVWQILFAFNQMEKPFSADFAEILLTHIDLTPECFVLAWLTELHVLNEFYRQLQIEGLLHVHEYKALNLPIHLLPDTVTEVYRKSKLIYDELKKASKQGGAALPTLDDLFKIIEPVQQKVYQTLRDKYQSLPIDRRLQQIWDEVRKPIDHLLDDTFISTLDDNHNIIEKNRENLKKILPKKIDIDKEVRITIEQSLISWLATIDFSSVSHAAQIRFFSILKDAHPRFALNHLTLNRIEWSELSGLLFAFPLQSLTVIGWQDAGLKTLLDEKIQQHIKELKLILTVVDHDGLNTQSWLKLIYCGARLQIQLASDHVLKIDMQNPLLWQEAIEHQAPDTILHFLWESSALQVAFDQLEQLYLEPNQLIILITHWLQWQITSQKQIDVEFAVNIGKCLQLFLKAKHTHCTEYFIQQLTDYLEKQQCDVFPIAVHHVLDHLQLDLADNAEKLLILDTLGHYFRLDNKCLTLPLTPIESSALLHMAIIQKKIGAAILLLHANALMSYADQAGQTALHIFTRHSYGYSNQEAVSLCQLLLSFVGAEVNYYDQRGYTPILYLLSLCQEMPTKAEILLAAFVKHGANPDAVDFETGETLLDKAIDKNYLQAFTLLVKQGASAVKDVAAMLTFIEVNFAGEIKANLLSQLQQKNPAIDWRITLQKLMPTTPASPDAKPMTGAFSGKRYLLQSLKERQTLYGRHDAKILYQDNNELFFKKNPELPGIEIAVSLLTHMLFKHGTPYSELFRENINGKPQPMLVSQVVKGVPLQKILESENWEEQLSQLDPEYLSEMLLRSLLVLLEDGIPANFNIVPFINSKGKKSYHLVNMDNDHGFVEPLKVNKQGEYELQVICIIWCLDQMQQKIDPVARERFLKHNPVAFLKQWLNTLSKIEKQHFALFNQTKERELLLFKQKANCEAAINTPIRPHVAKLYLRFLRIQRALKKYPDLTGLQLLGYVIPQLNQCHQEVFAQGKKNPLERLALIKKSLNKPLLEIRSYEYQTLASASKILEMQGLPLKEMVKEDNDYGPKAAIQDLENLAKEVNQFIDIKQALVSGNLIPFNNIVHDGLREKILSGFNFNVLNKLNQKELLKSIKKGGFYRIHIKGCSELTDNDLLDILKASPGLTSLTLSDCQQITDRCWEFISKYGLALKKITLEKLPKLMTLGVEDNALDLPALENLTISECQLVDIISIESKKLEKLEMSEVDVKNITVNTPSLRHLTLTRCEKLHGINITAQILQEIQIKYCNNLFGIVTNSNQLTVLIIHNCKKLSNRSLFTIAHDTIHLNELVVKGCPEIVVPELIARYPFLLNEHLIDYQEKLPYTFKEQLPEMIENAKSYYFKRCPNHIKVKSIIKDIILLGYLRKYIVFENVCQVLGTKAEYLFNLSDDNRISMDPSPTTLQTMIRNDPIFLKTMLFAHYGETANRVSSLVNLNDLVRNVFTQGRIEKVMTLSKRFAQNLLTVCDDACPDQFVPYLLARLHKDKDSIESSVQTFNQYAIKNFGMIADVSFLSAEVKWPKSNIQALKKYAAYLKKENILNLLHALNENEQWNAGILDILKACTPDRLKEVISDLIDLVLTGIESISDQYHDLGRILSLVEALKSVYVVTSESLKFNIVANEGLSKSLTIEIKTNENSSRLTLIWNKCCNRLIQLSLNNRNHFIMQVLIKDLFSVLNYRRDGLTIYPIYQNVIVASQKIIVQNMLNEYLANLNFDDLDSLKFQNLFKCQSILIQQGFAYQIASYFVKLILHSSKTNDKYIGNLYELASLIIAYVPHAADEVVPALLAFVDNPSLVDTGEVKSAFRILEAYALHCPEKIVPFVLSFVSRKESRKDSFFASRLKLLEDTLNKHPYTEKYAKLRFDMFNLLQKCAPYDFDKIVPALLEMLLKEDIEDYFFEKICDVLSVYYLKKQSSIQIVLSFLATSYSNIPLNNLITFADMVLGKYALHEAHVVIPSMETLLHVNKENEKLAALGVAFTVLMAYAAAGNEKALSILLDNDEFLSRTSDVQLIIKRFVEKNQGNLISILSRLSNFNNPAVQKIAVPFNDFVATLESLPLLNTLNKFLYSEPIDEKDILQSKEAIKAYLDCKTDEELAKTLLPFLIEENFSFKQDMTSKSDTLFFLLFKYWFVQEKPSGKEFYIRTILKAMLDEIQPEVLLKRSFQVELPENKAGELLKKYGVQFSPRVSEPPSSISCNKDTAEHRP